MKHHRHSLLAAVSLLALSGTAQAADLENFSPAVSSWTGFYGAVGGGGKFVFSDLEANAVTAGGGPGMALGALDNFGEPGAFGTVELGYDQQLEGSGLVVGIVGNFDFGEEISAAVTQDNMGMGPNPTVAEWDIDHSWAVGVRAGFQATPSTLFYGVGGFTQADVTTSVIGGGMGMNAAPDVSDSEWESGYFVGAGVETQLNEHFGAKLEYRYANYGSASVSSDGFGMGGNMSNVASSDDLEAHSVRGTLVWRFNNASVEPEAAATLDTLPASWDGFYGAAGGGGRFIFTDFAADAIQTSGAKAKAPGINFIGGFEDFGEADAFGTVELGYDHQLEGSGIVVGAVGNFDFAGGATATVTQNMGMNAGQTLAEWEVGNSWGVGVRAGVQAMESTLIYAVGGFTQAEINSTIVGGGMGMGAVPSTSDSDWESGYFVGGGFETMLTGQIGAKLEYRYSNYDGASVTSGEFTTNMGKTSFQNEATSDDIDSHSVRGTLVWRFSNFDN